VLSSKELFMPETQTPSETQNEMWEEEKEEALNGKTQPDEEVEEEKEETKP